MPRVIAALVAAKYATLESLQTSYGVKDAYDMIEILAVDNHNQRALAKAARDG